MRKNILGIDLKRIIKDKRIASDKLYKVSFEEINLDEEIERIVWDLKSRDIHALYSPVNKNTRKLFSKLGALEFDSILPKSNLGINYANQTHFLKVLDDYEVVLRIDYLTEKEKDKYMDSDWFAQIGSFDSASSIKIKKEEVESLIESIKRWLVLNEDLISDKNDKFVLNKLFNIMLSDILD